MIERSDQLRAALAQIEDGWSPARTERTLAGVQQRVRRTRLRRGLGAAAGIAAAIAVGWVAWPAEREVARGAVGSQPVAAGMPRHMQFEDGSQVELLDPSARLVVDEVTRERIAVRLLGGRARVEVVPRKERAFRVQCGEVAVEVLGTAFELTRQGERTRVEVLRGRVAVHWRGGSSELAAGEAGWFPKAPAEVVQPTAAVPAARASGKKAHDSSWQAQAERGNFKRAYELLPERVSDDVQELLLAADAARLSGHPAEAVPFLRRVIERHPRDPRASLAAFTLGGVLLNQLDRPREAEQAYARARSLALSPALAQDALARQVEAAERAGDVRRLRELAEEYVRRYPDGRRIQWVRELSGL